jgi:putative transposase
VRLIKRADGYYVQFCIQLEREEIIEPTHKTIGLDVGLESFYTDSLGNKVENPRFYRTGEKKMKRSQRLVSRKVKGSSNRRKARVKLARVHLKISRQRKDHAIKLEYFGRVFGRITIPVSPAYTSQECSSCGVIVKKSLSTRTHVCQCGCVLDRDHNAGINILNSGLGKAGQALTSVLDAGKASGESTSILVGENLLG